MIKSLYKTFCLALSTRLVTTCTMAQHLRRKGGVSMGFARNSRRTFFQYITRLIVLSLAMTILCSCGKSSETPLTKYIGDDGTAIISISDFDLGDGAVGLPFFPPDVTEKNFSNYTGMTLDEFNDKYLGDTSAGYPGLHVKLSGLYGLTSFSIKDSGSQALIFFQMSVDLIDDDEWQEVSDEILSWLQENMEDTDSTTEFISKDGRTTIKLQVMSNSSSDSFVVGDGTPVEISSMTITYE